MHDDQPDPEAELELEVGGFVDRLTMTLSRSLGAEVVLVSDVATFGPASPRISVYQSEETGIPISVDARPTFRLLLRYECIWSEHPGSDGRRFLTVDASSFTVLFEGRSEPFLHYDYIRRPKSAIPAAHLNVHAHRDEVVHAMLLATRKRGKARAKKVDSGSITTLSQLHLPLGGWRFRPSVEDVLELLILEFGIDAAADARKVLADSRAEYRSVQVAAAAADDPAAAAKTLRSLGFEVTPPQETVGPRPDRLSQY